MPVEIGKLGKLGEKRAVPLTTTVSDEEFHARTPI
jgi:hypothetical protein